jgi:hypothetical protein
MAPWEKFSALVSRAHVPVGSSCGAAAVVKTRRAATAARRALGAPRAFVVVLISTLLSDAVSIEPTLPL